MAYCFFSNLLSMCRNKFIYRNGAQCWSPRICCDNILQCWFRTWTSQLRLQAAKRYCPFSLFFPNKRSIKLIGWDMY